MTKTGLDYIPGLIAAYQAGIASDHVHLGYWPTGKSLTWPQAQEAMTRLHLDALDLHDGMKIADIGCGIGGSLRIMNDSLRNATLIGVNIDPRQMEVCHLLAPKDGNSLHWIAADAGATGLASLGVDRILSLEAMFHFPRRTAFLTEAARILRPDGLLVCSDILLGPCDDDSARACRDLIVEGYGPWPHPSATWQDHITSAKDAGFNLLQTTDISSHIMRTWDHIVSARATPLSSPVAAMKSLHHAGLLKYVISIMQKPAT